MGIETCISSSTCKILAISERDMFTIGTFVAFSKTKIDNINGILSCICSTNKKIIWLDISVDDSFFVDDFDSLNHLY